MPRRIGETAAVEYNHSNEVATVVAFHVHTARNATRLPRQAVLLTARRSGAMHEAVIARHAELRLSLPGRCDQSASDATSVILCGIAGGLTTPAR